MIVCTSQLACIECSPVKDRDEVILRRVPNWKAELENPLLIFLSRSVQTQFVIVFIREKKEDRVIDCGTGQWTARVLNHD